MINLFTLCRVYLIKNMLQMKEILQRKYCENIISLLDCPICSPTALPTPAPTLTSIYVGEENKLKLPLYFCLLASPIVGRKTLRNWLN